MKPHHIFEFIWMQAMFDIQSLHENYLTQICYIKIIDSHYIDIDLIECFSFILSSIKILQEKLISKINLGHIFQYNALKLPPEIKIGVLWSAKFDCYQKR